MWFLRRSCKIPMTPRITFPVVVAIFNNFAQHWNFVEDCHEFMFGIKHFEDNTMNTPAKSLKWFSCFREIYFKIIFHEPLGFNHVSEKISQQCHVVLSNITVCKNYSLILRSILKSTEDANWWQGGHCYDCSIFHFILWIQRRF